MCGIRLLSKGGDDDNGTCSQGVMRNKLGDMCLVLTGAHFELQRVGQPSTLLLGQKESGQ